MRHRLLVASVFLCIGAVMTGALGWTTASVDPLTGTFERSRTATASGPLCRGFRYERRFATLTVRETSFNGTIDAEMRWGLPLRAFRRSRRLDPSPADRAAWLVNHPVERPRTPKRSGRLSSGVITTTAQPFDVRGSPRAVTSPRRVHLHTIPAAAPDLADTPLRIVPGAMAANTLILSLLALVTWLTARLLFVPASCFFLPARRFVRVALLSLLAGAGLSVAVAWGCLLGRPAAVAAGLAFSTPTGDQTRWWDRHRPDAGFGSLAGTRVDLPQSPGVEITTSIGDGGGTASIGTGGYSMIIRGRAGQRVIRNDCTHTRAGFPVLCLEGETWSSDLTTVATAALSGPVLGRRTRLTLRPMWPGFLTCTVIYALAFGMIISLPHAVRRWSRLRHHRCLRCGYPIGASSRCTECGETRAVIIAGPGEPWTE